MSYTRSFLYFPHQSYIYSHSYNVPLLTGQKYCYSPFKFGDVPCFWGFDDSYGYENWMNDLEELFSYYDMTNVQMYVYAKCRFNEVKIGG